MSHIYSNITKTSSPEIKAWEASGTYIKYGPNKHKIFVKQVGDPKANSKKTLLLIHGFPESSYSYHRILDGMLNTFDRVILFDMIGYGLSDKPENNYSYSLLEQADTTLSVWKHFGIDGGHIISHDMGVSVTTEILARHENNLLPSWFSKGIQSLTFTNGSMVLSMSRLRLMQKLLLTRYGKFINKFVHYNLFKQQVKSAHGNKNLTDKEIQLLWELNKLQNGHKQSYQTIKYLNDRKQFEKTRWLPALSQTEIPIHLCWGDQDQVAQVKMAYFLKENVCPQARLTIMNGLGHFCQLGNPQAWVNHINLFYTDL